ncbi:hypothetical protein [Paenibacillus sp. ALJ109b]|uniref:hypothetical protein n=1 Tax=Paenibacillus sp. ALJ109b TaxID=2709068 RepID=UPI0019678316|nr:hypothetical protein [Paenibacillus sp. ALJ109b]
MTYKRKAPGWYGDRRQTTVWRAGLSVEEPEQSTVWEVSRGDVGKYIHPTQKPLELLAIPIDELRSYIPWQGNRRYTAVYGLT